MRQFAGLTTWMAGLMPQLKPFATMIWAALQCSSTPTLLGSQIRTPLKWFKALAQAQFGPLARRCRDRAPYFTVIRFDGSLTGGGATLHCGVRDLKNITDNPPVTHWHGIWSDSELQQLQVKRGDPAGQARLEGLAMYLSFVLWRKIIAEAHGRLAVVGDALGVLHDALEFRAKDAVLNELMGDVALAIAPTGQSLQGAHVWSERNATCDALSRLAAGESPPSCLKGLPRTTRTATKFTIVGGRVSASEGRAKV